MADLTRSEKRAIAERLLRERASRELRTLPVSYGQRALWMIQQADPRSVAYNAAWSARLRSEIDPALLERCCQALVQRHGALRTTFRETGGDVVQDERGFQAVDFKQVDASSATEEELQQLVIASYREPFDLEHGPLFRARLFSRAGSDHVLLLTIHHIVCDAWSIWVLVDELAKLYAAGKVGGASPFPMPAAQYADFINWQREMLSGKEGERLWHGWRDRLSGELPHLDLSAQRPATQRRTVAPTHPRTLAPSHPRTSDSHFFTLDASLTDALKALAQREGVTLFMLLAAAYQALLHRYTRQSEVVLGSPVSGRSRAEFASTVGYFVNPVALRLETPERATFTDLLKSAKARVLEALTHQDYPFPLLVERLQPRRDGLRSPIFQTLFVLQTPSDLTWDGVALESYEIPQMEGQFELGLDLIQTRDSLRGILKFDEAVLDAEAAARMAGHLETLLRSVASDPTQRVADIPLLGAAEQRQIVEQWNATRVRYDGTPLLHEHIERQALRTPDAVAVSFNGHYLTYSALNAASNRLAHALRRLGVGPDVVVGVSLERSIDLVVALLAVLKAGGAYLPIDLDYPLERQRFMRDDSRCALVLTHEMLAGLEVKRESDRNPAVAVDPDNLAYVFYTSGSTGAPKGAMTTHRAICNRLLWMQEAYKLDATDCVLQKTPFSFDVSVWEFFWPLMTGARLAVARPGGHRDSAYLAQTITDERVTTIHFVPSMLQIFATERGLDRCASLERVICSGETLQKDLQDRVLSAIPSAELHNLYGPTEAAVDVTAWHCRAEDEGRSVPIGRPIANTQVYVLDESMRPTPVGVPGELYLGGVNLARGYVHRPDLTAERFVPNPFAPGTRLYKTGDLCCYRPDGAVEYLGRLDHQVKIRGVRIELGEIEAVLARHPAVREAAVVVDNAADPRLVAFIVKRGQTPHHGSTQGLESVHEGGLTPFATEARQFARTHLPESMVPSFLIPLDRLPLLPNGKLDRTALLREAHGHQRPSSRQPKSEAERRIAAIWCDLLARERVGTDDNFFEIGGHSLLAIRLLRRLEEAFGSPLVVTDIFQYPTVAALARRVTGDPATNYHLPTTSQELPPTNYQLPTGPQLPPTNYQLPTGDPVAVIGMSCRFPGASGVEAFWENLRGGVESIARFTDEELMAAGVDAALLKDPAYVRARAVLPAIEYFDAEFFGFSPREAAVLDPQHRLFLECAWETLEDAGYDSSRHGGAIGVYAGAGLNTYLLHNVYQNPDAVRAVGPFQVMIGNDKDYLPTRVSYTLDLRGPSISVQSACSTSLVAIHMAARAVLAGECDMALAGAVSIPVPQVAGYRYQEGMILSPDGHCRPFDARAAGTVGGSGVGIVLLKPLSRALADRDHIVGLIRGTAVNNDGRTKVGYTAPSVEGQQAVIAQALAHAGVSPDSIGYLEAHGTGTALGDPIEGRAIARAFAARSEGIPRCVIGSVKSNIGHLDAAAGMAGFIKTLLALQHRAIPPTLHFGRLNPDVELDPARFEVETKLREWPAGEGPRRAGVSSFGIGGTNAHLVVEEAPAAPAAAEERTPQLLVLSARTPSALDTAVARLGEHLRVHPELPLADVAHTLQVGRRQFQHRCALVCDTTADASRLLVSPELASRSADDRSVRLQPDRVGVSPSLAEGERRRAVTGIVQDVPAPVTFMFPGQGAQHVRMGAGLYDREPVFRSHVDRCAALLEPHLGFDLRSVLYQRTEKAGHEAAAEETLRSTSIAQPALFVTSYALAQVWLSRGVQPAALIGHSIGEYVAAAFAGVFSLEDALRLVAARGRLLQALPPGSMLAVALPAEAVEPLLTTLDPTRLAIAAVNGPASCVVSGESDAIDALERLVRERGGICHRLHTSHAFHSPMMDAALPAFIDEVARTPLSPPQVPIVSNLTGTWLTAEQAVDPQYWAQHLRRTVRFFDGLRTLLDESCILLEVGPGRTLTGLAAPHVRRDDQQLAVASMRHALDTKADEKTTYVASGFLGAPKLGTSEGGSRTVENADEASLLDAAAKLWVAGVNMQWSAFGPPVRRRVSLPTYPFERQRHWIEASVGVASVPARPAAVEASGVGAGGVGAGIEQWFWLPSWRRAALPAPRDEHPTSWLALIDETGLGADLLRELRVRGDRVIAVTPGDRFARLGHDRYLVRPGERADYDRLVKAIHAEPGELPRGIVHAWCLTEPGTRNVEPGTTNSELGTQNLELRQARVFLSLLYLAQALETVDETRFEVTVLSSRMQAVAGEAVLDPDAALLLGPVRTIPLEYSHIACRSVDVAPGHRGPNVSNDPNIAAIVTELDAFGVDAVVAYRDNQRWVCEHAQVPLAPAAPRLRRGGVYLITGGYGGVGLTLAEHLARTYAARLVLIGRTKLDETRRHALNERLGVGRSGAHAIYAAADVTDPRRMREVIAEAMSAFGEISGVIHAAGVAAGGIVQRKTKATVDPILAPKVAGTRVLYDVLHGIPIDFCVLMSSVTGLVGEFGQVDYGAANAFMDAFAHARHREGAPWISIDWDTWSEVGMAATTALPKELEAHRAERLASGIRSAEGVAAFERVLGSGLPQVAVSPRDLRVRSDEGPREIPGMVAPLVAPLVAPHGRPVLSSTYAVPASETAQELEAIWRTLLGVEPIGVQDDFFELGGHSLLATQMLTRIRDAFGVRLSMSAIFEAPTIAQLAEQVDAARLAEADPDTLARILNEIKGLASE